MSDTTKYLSDKAQRILKTVDILFGHEIDGLTPGQISQAVGCSPANTTSDIANLIEAGFVERIEAQKTYRIAARLASRCLASLNTIDQAQREVADLRQRFTAKP